LTQGSVAPNALLSAKGINYAPYAAHEEVEAVGNLDRAWRPLAGTVGQRATAVPADHLDTRVLTQPGRERPRGRLRQQVDGPVAFVIDQDQAVLPTATMRPLIDAEDAWRAGGKRFGSLPHQPQQRHPAGAQVQAPDQPGTRPTAERQADRLQERRQEAATASVGGDQRRQPLAEDAAWAPGEDAAKAARGHVEQHTRSTPAQVGDVPLVAAVH
jgi:hypothetical protein